MPLSGECATILTQSRLETRERSLALIFPARQYEYPKVICPDIVQGCHSSSVSGHTAAAHAFARGLTRRRGAARPSCASIKESSALLKIIAGPRNRNAEAKSNSPPIARRVLANPVWAETGQTCVAEVRFAITRRVDATSASASRRRANAVDA